MWCLLQARCVARMSSCCLHHENNQRLLGIGVSLLPHGRHEERTPLAQAEVRNCAVDMTDGFLTIARPILVLVLLLGMETLKYLEKFARVARVDAEGHCRARTTRNRTSNQTPAELDICVVLG